jgi:hypothetical protein
LTFVNASGRPDRLSFATEQWRATMDAGNMAYLGVVIGSMAIFAIVLAYASIVAPGDKKPRT